MGRNAECARSFYEAFNQRGLDALSEDFFHPSVVVVEPPEMPDATTTFGINAARAGLAKFTSLFDDVVVTIEELLDQGDRTFTTIRVVGTGTGSGVAIDVKRYDVATWRDARVVRFKAYFERADALRAFEGSS